MKKTNQELLDEIIKELEVLKEDFRKNRDLTLILLYIKGKKD